MALTGWLVLGIVSGLATAYVINRIRRLRRRRGEVLHYRRYDE